MQREFVKRMPTNPNALQAPARIAAARGDFDTAERLGREVEPRIAGSRSSMIGQLGFMSDLALVRGKLREAGRLRSQQRERQLQVNASGALLQAGLDSVRVAAVVREDAASARALLDRALRRAPVDSIPVLDRNYDLFLAVAALSGDTVRARQWHAAARAAWAQGGRTVDRPAWESMADASLAIAEGRYADALAKVDEADRRLLSRTDLLGSLRFLVLDRLQRADSAVAAGESYLAVTHVQRLGQDAVFLPGIRQRLGEMYEAKGNLEKALEHYQAFVELWKDADPELQPRVRDVRGRVERIRRQLGRAG